MKASFWNSVDTRTPVVVLYKGEKGALALARSLGRLGVPLYLVTPRGSTAEQRERYGMVEQSRYWRELFFWDYHKSAEETVQFLHKIARSIGRKPILMTLSDWAAIFIEQNAAALEEHYMLSRAQQPIIERLANKWDMFQLAQQYGIPTPLTIYPQTHTELATFLRDAPAPYVMKTADASLPYIPQKAIVATKEEALRKWNADAEKGPPNLIVQEFVPGGPRDVWMCNAYFTGASECLAVYTGRKLRQISDTGVATLAVCEQNTAVADLTKRFMQSVGYSGAVGIGYRYDARDGSYKLLDVNARVSGVFRLFRSPDGTDTARIAYLHLSGQRTPQATLDDGRKWMLEDDLPAAYRAWRRGKLSVADWLRSMYGVHELHWLAADDPRPAMSWMRYTFVRPIIEKSKALGRRLMQPLRYTLRSDSKV